MPNKGKKGKYKKGPALWEAAFLKAFARNGIVTQAAKAAKVSLSNLYRRRDEHPEFRQLWDEAREEAMDVMEKEAQRRAVEGVKRKKFDRGQPVIDPATGEQYVEQEYSDTLLIFLLKGGRPDKFRDRQEIMGKDGGPVEQVVFFLPHNGRESNGTSGDTAPDGTDAIPVE